MNYKLYLFFILQPTLCCSIQKTGSMEIFRLVSQSSEAKRFIGNYFDKVSYDVNNPIHPYPVNYVCISNSMTFCSLPVVRCWARQWRDKYAFLIIVKERNEALNTINAAIGDFDASSAVTSEFKQIGGGYWGWYRREMNLYLTKYYNYCNIPGLEDCDLIIVSNVSHREIVFDLDE